MLWRIVAETTLPASAQLKKTWRGDNVPNRRSCERREVVCLPGKFRFSRYDGIASSRKFAKRFRAAFSPGSGTFAGEVKAQSSNVGSGRLETVEGVRNARILGESDGFSS